MIEYNQEPLVVNLKGFKYRDIPLNYFNASHVTSFRAPRLSCGYDRSLSKSSVAVFLELAVKP